MATRASLASTTSAPTESSLGPRRCSEKPHSVPQCRKREDTRLVQSRRGFIGALGMTAVGTISILGPAPSQAYTQSLQQRLQEIQAMQMSNDFRPSTSGTGRLLERVQKCQDEVKRIGLLASVGEYQNAKALLLSGSAKQLQQDLGYATGLYANVLDPRTAKRTLAVYKRLEAGLSRELPASECAARVALVEESLADLTLQLQLAGE